MVSSIDALERREFLKKSTQKFKIESQQTRIKLKLINDTPNFKAIQPIKNEENTMYIQTTPTFTQYSQ